MYINLVIETSYANYVIQFESFRVFEYKDI